MRRNRSIRTNSLLLQMSGRTDHVTKLTDKTSKILTLATVRTRHHTPHSKIIIDIGTRTKSTIRGSGPYILVTPHSTLRIQICVHRGRLPHLGRKVTMQISKSNLHQNHCANALARVSSTTAIARSKNAIIRKIIRLSTSRLSSSVQLNLATGTRIIIDSVRRAFIVPCTTLRRSRTNERFICVLGGNIPAHCTMPSNHRVASKLTIVSRDLHSTLIIARPRLIIRSNLTIAMQRIRT